MTTELLPPPSRRRLARMPITKGALRRLRAEVHRLREHLQADRAPTTAGDAPTIPTDAADAALDWRRLRELDLALDAAELVDADGTVVVGSRVTIREADGARVSLEIVPPGLAVPADGHISPDSPLGGALLGRRAGELVRVAAPGGTRDVLVDEVR